MNSDDILEELKKIVDDKKSKGYTLEHNRRYSKCEFLYATLSLMGFAHSQIEGSNEGDQANEFWPFGIFEPDSDPKKNLLRACAYLIDEIERI